VAPRHRSSIAAGAIGCLAAVPLSGPLRAFDRLRALWRLVEVAGAEKRPSQPNRETGLTDASRWSALVTTLMFAANYARILKAIDTCRT
jgi:hypothetical protein